MARLSLFASAACGNWSKHVCSFLTVVKKSILQESELRQDFVPKSDNEKVMKIEMQVCR